VYSNTSLVSVCELAAGYASKQAYSEPDPKPRLCIGLVFVRVLVPAYPAPRLSRIKGC